MAYPFAPPKRRFWITQLLRLVCFLVVPLLVTLLIPAPWVTLTRDTEGRVSATARTCVHLRALRRLGASSTSPG